jgi:hypothetical protein
MIIFLIGEDFILCWSHRLFHGNQLWKYHAVHHSSEDLEWISAARFDPINLFFGSVLADVVMLLAGISPNIFFVLGPIPSALGFRPCQSRLDARAIQTCDRIAGFPSLASHRRRTRRREELRRDVPGSRSHLRHVLHAERRFAGPLWHRRRGISGGLRRPTRLSVQEQAHRGAKACATDNFSLITGKSYGATNFIATDKRGAVLLEKAIEVSGPRDRTVVMYNGAERQTYSCTPDCSRRLTLGDTPDSFDKTLSEITSLNAQATAAGALSSGQIQLDSRSVGTNNGKQQQQ